MSTRAEAIVAEVERAVVGKRDALELVLLALLADGHVLIEDNPGLAKTLIARSFAAVDGICDFSRMQFTPDLMPADITGCVDLRSARWDVRVPAGPDLHQVLLADEINRAPPKTQAALLEAMQERQVTSEDGTRSLEPPFLVLATQNPIEFEGTYPLPEAQLDRFLVRVSIGYPSRDDEWEILRRRATRGVDEVEIEAAVDREQLLAMQRALERVHVGEGIGYYMVDLVAATRAHASVQVGASPAGDSRVAEALARRGRRCAGRDYVTPDDVKQVAVPALAHRLVLRPELWVQNVEAGQRCRRVSRPGAGAAGREGRQWRRRASWRLRAYCALSAAALLGALASGRPQLVRDRSTLPRLPDPALGLARETGVSVDVAALRNRVLEGEPIPIALTLTAGRACVEIELRLVGATRWHRCCAWTCPSGARWK